MVERVSDPNALPWPRSGSAAQPSCSDFVFRNVDPDRVRDSQLDGNRGRGYGQNPNPDCPLNHSGNRADHRKPEPDQKNCGPFAKVVPKDPTRVHEAPNGWRLSGERSGAKRVRCSRGLGARLMACPISAEELREKEPDC